jgi:hypothetical protein
MKTNPFTTSVPQSVQELLLVPTHLAVNCPASIFPADLPAVSKAPQVSTPAMTLLLPCPVCLAYLPIHLCRSDRDYDPANETTAPTRTFSATRTNMLWTMIAMATNALLLLPRTMLLLLSRALLAGLSRTVEQRNWLLRHHLQGMFSSSVHLEQILTCDIRAKKPPPPPPMKRSALSSSDIPRQY